MLYQIYAITVKELKILSRDAAALSLLFVMPIMFILVMSVALNGVFEGGSKDHPVQVLVVNTDRGQAAERVITSLKAVGGMEIIEDVDGARLTRQSADQLIVAGKYHVALIFPTDFSHAITAAASSNRGTDSVVTFVVDPSVGNSVMGPIRGTVQGYVEREASITQSPVRISNGFDDVVKNAPVSAAPIIQQAVQSFTDGMDNSNKLETAKLGVSFEETPPQGMHIEKMPDSAQQNVPGYTIFGVFFIMQPLALSIYEEKTSGTFRRLQAAPLSRAALLVGKLIPFFIINLIQMALMFGVGVVVFHISLGNDPWALVLVAVATALAANGMGLMITALAKTREQMGGLASLLSVTLAAVGGMMVPTFIMPGAMQVISKITPHAWALAGFQDVIVRGMGVADVLPKAGVLLVFATVFFAIAMLRFRFE
jgi:ABC-2 type transport system permease protein